MIFDTLERHKDNSRGKIKRTCSPLIRTAEFGRIHTIELFGYYSDIIRILFGYYSDIIRILFGYNSDIIRILFGYYSDIIRILFGSTCFFSRVSIPQLMYLKSVHAA